VLTIKSKVGKGEISMKDTQQYSNIGGADGE
jgi:hypothetical protein